ncbi:protocadherin Fat 3-like isoform X3 [Anarrhichthys ocellatus]|uniref:protocadherin Fat 3-like isoform X3 n=1 Tax=Anarrhichthys ocellatus TaxID=433405 RepID=UPI0012EDB5FD|nr:protocadherin Fat 3-like isoform X3 [Anarrhichthys ocellatus]
MVDMAEEVTCFSGSNKSSNSEVQSLSSFQSDSCDDNAYHWDTSDWMPSTRLSDIEEVPGYEAGPASDVAGSAPRLGGSTRELESDYYLGGYDIDSDYPPPHEEEFLSQDQLPPPLPTVEDYAEPYTPLPTNPPVSKESTLSSGSTGCQHARPHFHPSQYLPPHQLPVGEAPHGDFSTSMSGISPGNGDTDDSVSLNMRLSVGASSASDMSAPCGLDDSENGSDFDSMDELRRGVTIITDSQQQTEV